MFYTANHLMKINPFLNYIFNNHLLKSILNIQMNIINTDFINHHNKINMDKHHYIIHQFTSKMEKNIFIINKHHLLKSKEIDILKYILHYLKWIHLDKINIGKNRGQNIPYIWHYIFHRQLVLFEKFDFWHQYNQYLIYIYKNLSYINDKMILYKWFPNRDIKDLFFQDK